MLLTARRTRALVDRRDRWLGGRVFGAVDDANDVLPPVDVVRVRGRAQLARTAVWIDRMKRLKQNNVALEIHVEIIAGSYVSLTAGARW